MKNNFLFLRKEEGGCVQIIRHNIDHLGAAAGTHTRRRRPRVCVCVQLWRSVRVETARVGEVAWEGGPAPPAGRADGPRWRCVWRTGGVCVDGGLVVETVGHGWSDEWNGEQIDVSVKIHKPSQNKWFVF